MPELDSDTFSYSAGNLATVSSGKWTKLAGFTDILADGSGAVNGTASVDSVDVISSWSGSTTDQYSEVTASAFGTGDGGPTVHSDGANNFYLLDFGQSTTGTLYKCEGGVFGSPIGSGDHGGINFGDVVRLTSQSGVLTATKNGGAAFITVSNNVIPSGKPGMHISGTGQAYSAWAAGDFGGGASAALATTPASVTEADIVDGGVEITLTLTDDTFIA